MCTKMHGSLVEDCFCHLSQDDINFLRRQLLIFGLHKKTPKMGRNWYTCFLSCSRMTFKNRDHFERVILLCKSHPKWTTEVKGNLLEKWKHLNLILSIIIMYFTIDWLNFPFLFKPISQNWIETCMNGVPCTFRCTLYLRMHFELSLLKVQSTSEGTLLRIYQYMFYGK